MYLITGGAGFIGSHLAEALIRKGDKVRILDNLSTGKKENLEEIAGKKFPESLSPGGMPKLIPLGNQIELLFGDITDLNTCRRGVEGISIIFHEAALGSVQRSVEDPLSSHQANATGTLNILQAAREARVKRFIYASSSSVYGNVLSDPEGALPKRESLPANPQSPYAATKLQGEIYCRLFSELYGLDTVSLRYFNVFGPRQSPDSIYAAVIPKFVLALWNGDPPIIFGDGEQTRDFTSVDNVVSANLLASVKPGISGRVFNIACGEQTSVKGLLSSLQEISGVKIPARREEARRGEVRHSLADVSQARQHLGYAVQTGLAAGLEATWKWFIQKRGRSSR